MSYRIKLTKESVRYFVTPGVAPTLHARHRFRLLMMLLFPVFGNPTTQHIGSRQKLKCIKYAKNKTRIAGQLSISARNHQKERRKTKTEIKTDAQRNPVSGPKPWDQSSNRNKLCWNRRREKKIFCKAFIGLQIAYKIGCEGNSVKPLLRGTLYAIPKALS